MSRNKYQGIDYLKHMLEWERFNKDHPAFAPAVKSIIETIEELSIKYTIAHITNRHLSNEDKRLRNELKKGLDIVYCKECRFLEISGPYGECSKCLWLVDPNDYCSRGERR